LEHEGKIPLNFNLRIDGNKWSASRSGCFLLWAIRTWCLSDRKSA